MGREERRKEQERGIATAAGKEGRGDETRSNCGGGGGGGDDKKEGKKKGRGRGMVKRGRNGNRGGGKRLGKKQLVSSLPFPFLHSPSSPLLCLLPAPCPATRPPPPPPPSVPRSSCFLFLLRPPLVLSLSLSPSLFHPTSPSFLSSPVFSLPPPLF